MKCPECSARIPEKAKECPVCGFLVHDPMAPLTFGDGEGRPAGYAGEEETEAEGDADLPDRDVA